MRVVVSLQYIALGIRCWVRYDTVRCVGATHSSQRCLQTRVPASTPMSAPTADDRLAVAKASGQWADVHPGHLRAHARLAVRENTVDNAVIVTIPLENISPPDVDDIHKYFSLLVTYDFVIEAIAKFDARDVADKRKRQSKARKLEEEMASSRSEMHNAVTALRRVLVTHGAFASPGLTACETTHGRVRLRVDALAPEPTLTLPTEMFTFYTHVDVAL